MLATMMIIMRAAACVHEWTAELIHPVNTAFLVFPSDLKLF